MSFKNSRIFYVKKNKAMCENNPGFWNNMKEELDSTLQVKVCLKVMVPGGWVEVLKTKRVSMIYKKKLFM